MTGVKSYSAPIASNLRKEALSQETFNGVEELRQTPPQETIKPMPKYCDTNTTRTTDSQIAGPPPPKAILATLMIS
jgi:hypothetical protein